MNGYIDTDSILYPQEAFEERLHRELARSLRSQRPFLLMLIDFSVCGPGEELTILAERIASVLSSSTRETDVKGWYAEGAVIGTLFTEFGSMRDAVDAAEKVIVGRLYEDLSTTVSAEDMLRVRIVSYALLAKPAAFQAPRRDDVFSLPLFLPARETSEDKADERHGAPLHDYLMPHVITFNSRGIEKEDGRLTRAFGKRLASGELCLD